MMEAGRGGGEQDMSIPDLLSRNTTNWAELPLFGLDAENYA